MKCSVDVYGKMQGLLNVGGVIWRLMIISVILQETISAPKCMGKDMVGL